MSYSTDRSERTAPPDRTRYSTAPVPASGPAPLTPTRRRQLRKLLKAIDLDCDCVCSMEPVCVKRGGCELRRQGKECACPRWPGPPCPHLVMKALVAALGRVQFDDWAALLRRAWDEPTTEDNDYLERPRASAGETMLTKEEALSVRILRAELGLDLWHPEDNYSKRGVARTTVIVGYKDGPDGYPRPIKEERLIAVKDGLCVREEAEEGEAA